MRKTVNESKLMKMLRWVMCMVAASFGGWVAVTPIAHTYNITSDQEPVTEPALEVVRVSESFNKIENQNDKIVIYKLFAGAAEYLSVCQSLSNTSQFDAILGKVQSSYGWEREKYSDFTDAVSDYLISVGYNEPKPLTSQAERLAFAKIFQTLAEAVAL